MNRLLGLDFKQKDDRNALYLVLEMGWASILASAAMFNSAFAVRLGATNTQVGLLTSIPALMAVLVSFPAGHFLQTRRQAKPWILSALTFYRAGFLLVALLPWLALTHFPLGTQVIFVLVVFTLPAHFFNVGFIPMLAEVTPEGRRAAVFSARNIVYNASLTVTVFLFGQWLSWARFPVNYQVMYIFGFLTSLMSVFYLVRVKVPDRQVGPPEPRQARSLGEQLCRARQAISGHPEIFRITTNTFMHGMGVWAASALYVLYFVRVLGASDAWIGLQGTVASACTILGYAFWRAIIGRWGESKVLKLTIVCLGLYPMLTGLLPSLTAILFVSGLNALIAPGVNLAHFNTLLKVTPPQSRPAYTAMYMSFVNTGAFIFPLVGVWVADRIGLAPTLIACGIFSILGSTSFWWRPVHGHIPRADLVSDVQEYDSGSAHSG
jgi:Na+/melibiose symporter-like transporter